MPRAPAFELLCEIADRNHLTVEILTNPAGASAIWVFPEEEPAEFDIADELRCRGIRVGIVATPFWDVPFDAASPQLIRMLAERGYS